MEFQVVPVRRSYRRYDTSLKILVAAGLPGAAVDRDVPHSTLAAWRKIDFSTLIGVSGENARDIALLRRFLKDRAGRRLFSLYAQVTDIFHGILGPVKDIHKAWSGNKKKILEVVREIQRHLGLKKTLRLFGLSVSQYYSWLREKGCPFSPLRLCRRRHPGQLPDGQLRGIKKLLAAHVHQTWPLVSVYFQGLRAKTIS